MKIKNKNIILILICAAIFISGAIGSIIVLTAPKKNTVNIISGGKLIETIDLSTSENRSFKVEYNESSNTIEIKDGKIRVSEAECPDKTCVHMGWLDSSAAPIVCLPNHLVIEFTGGGEIDTVTR